MLAEETRLMEMNKQTVRRWVEMAWNGGDFSEANSVYAPDYTLHNSAGLDVRGPEGITNFITLYRAGLPDLVMSLEDMIAEGNKVAWRVIVRATHRGELFGIPPTGRAVSVEAIVLTHFRNGQWVDEWVNSDDFGMLAQLGVVPAPGGHGEAGEVVSTPVDRVEAAGGSRPMSVDEKKKLARVYWEDIFSDGRFEASDEIATAGWTIHNPGVHETLHGPEAMKAVVRTFRTAFPDFRATVRDQLVEGDRVVTRVTSTGTHLGELMGIPPTGRKAEIGGLAIDRLEGGRLAERWGVFDLLGLLRQLGVVPEGKG